MRYYNHDHIWTKRREAKNPIWGSYSNKCYQDVAQHIGRIKLPPARILDLGCGAGAAGQWFRELGYAYTGADESKAAIDLGVEYFRDLDLHHVDFAEEIQIETWRERFDVAVSINVLHCLVEPSDRMELLKSALYCLQREGSLVLTTMCLPMAPDFRQADSPRCYKTVEEIRSEFELAGFKEIETLEFIPVEGRAKISNLVIKGQKQ